MAGVAVTFRQARSSPNGQRQDGLASRHRRMPIGFVARELRSATPSRYRVGTLIPAIVFRACQWIRLATQLRSSMDGCKTSRPGSIVRPTRSSRNSTIQVVSFGATRANARASLRVEAGIETMSHRPPVASWLYVSMSASWPRPVVLSVRHSLQPEQPHELASPSEEWRNGS